MMDPVRAAKVRLLYSTMRNSGISGSANQIVTQCRLFEFPSKGMFAAARSDQ